jgi:transcription antitermination factor NusG
MEEKSNWKVIYTASRQEKKVVILLDRYGIENYLPLVKKLRLWSDRKKWVDVPLFNGYIFLKSTEELRYKILEIPGVVRFLRYNGNDATLPETEIDTIKRIIQTGYDTEIMDVQFDKGQTVMITSGPLKGIEAEVLRIDKHNNAVLIGFETISKTLKVTLPAGLLQKKKIVG